MASSNFSKGIVSSRGSSFSPSGELSTDFLHRCYKVGAAACRDPNFVNFTSTVMKNIDEAQSHHLFYEYLLAIDNQDACRASWHTYAGNVIDGVGSAVVVVVGFDTVDACYQTFAAADVTFAI